MTVGGQLALYFDMYRLARENWEEKWNMATWNCEIYGTDIVLNWEF